MKRTTLAVAFVALVAVPLSVVYLIRSGYYPAAIANGNVISGRSFERTVADVSRGDAAAAVSLPVLRRTVLDRMIESAILSAAPMVQAGTEGAASAALVAQARREARVIIFVSDLTWKDGAVVAR